MQLYSSSSISFTFRQYDCMRRGGEPGSQWPGFLDPHPQVSSSPATPPVPPGHTKSNHLGHQVQDLLGKDGSLDGDSEKGHLGYEALLWEGTEA